MRFQMTQDIVDAGVPGCFHDCPVAIIIRLTLGLLPDQVRVHRKSIRVDGKRYTAPNNVVEFVADFDGLRSVSPIEFELDL